MKLEQQVTSLVVREVPVHFRMIGYNRIAPPRGLEILRSSHSIADVRSGFCRFEVALFPVVGVAVFPRQLIHLLLYLLAGDQCNRSLPTRRSCSMTDRQRKVSGGQHPSFRRK
jgi:hypothetical protein